MIMRRLGALAGVGAVAPSATGVQIGNHATRVSVVVDFNGKVPAGQVEFDRLTTTTATLHIAHRGITTQTAGATAHGVHVALQPGTQALHIATSFAPHRFKYVSYGTVLNGKRVVISLWKSAPPPGGGAFGYGGGGPGCLSIKTWSVAKGGVISASGSESGVFENTFQVVVRGANGTVLGRRTIVNGPSWSTTVKYTASRRQAGTLEAVQLSPKDGSLACLYEERVTLPATS